MQMFAFCITNFTCLFRLIHIDVELLNFKQYNEFVFFHYKNYEFDINPQFTATYFCNWS
jgi:hypothetical protein